MNLIELLGEELAAQIAAVAQEKGINIILDNVDKPEYVQKTQYEEDFKKQLETKNSEWQSKFDSNLLDSEIKIAAIKSKAKDPADIMAFIDKSKCKIENGIASGIEDQIKALSESKAYLFGEAVPGGDGANPAGSGNQDKDINSLDAAIGEHYNK